MQQAAGSAHFHAHEPVASSSDVTAAYTKLEQGILSCSCLHEHRAADGPSHASTFYHKPQFVAICTAAWRALRCSSPLQNFKHRVQEPGGAGNITGGFHL